MKFSGPKADRARELAASLKACVANAPLTERTIALVKQLNPLRTWNDPDLDRDGNPVQAATPMRLHISDAMRRSALLGGVVHFTSDFGLAVSHRLSPLAWNTYTGLNWLGVAGLLTAQKYKEAGIAQLSACGLTILQGSHLFQGGAADRDLMLGALVYVPQGVLYAIEEWMTAHADELKKDPHLFARVAGQVLQFPVAIGAGLGVVGGFLLVNSHLAHTEATAQSVFSAWIAGEVLVGASDPRLREFIRGKFPGLLGDPTAPTGE